VSTPFVSASQLKSLRSLVEHGFQTDIEIWPKSTVTASADNVYGDDAETWTYSVTVQGWIFSTPSPVIETYAGKMGLLNTYRCFLPVDTELDSGDKVKAEGHFYVVSDTVKESTWLPLLRASLRRID
jgi:hypothetical protein